jgi:hypothetical protein
MPGDHEPGLSPSAGDPPSGQAGAPVKDVADAGITLDVANQPAPTRRAHPAIPKVRPVIRGAAEKIPAWLALGTTAAGASASFETDSPTEVERIAPIATASSAAARATADEPPHDRPEWLVEAEAVAADSHPLVAAPADWQEQAPKQPPTDEQVVTDSASDPADWTSEPPQASGRGIAAVASQAIKNEGPPVRADPASSKSGDVG